MHGRLTEQLWKKVAAYENLLLRNASDLSQDQQSAIQRALLMVCTISSKRSLETLMILSLQKLSATQIWYRQLLDRVQRRSMVATVVASLKRQVLAQWGLLVT